MRRKRDTAKAKQGQLKGLGGVARGNKNQGYCPCRCHGDKIPSHRKEKGNRGNSSKKATIQKSGKDRMQGWKQVSLRTNSNNNEV